MREGSLFACTLEQRLSRRSLHLATQDAAKRIKPDDVVRKLNGS
jgi:hypothetical protein